MDKIILRELKVQTVIGIWEWERRIKQTVSLDLQMATDVGKAAATDSIEDALDYKDIAKRLIEFTESSEFELIETLADAIAAIVVREFGVPWVRVYVVKPGAIEGSREVGVEIERGTDDYA